MRRIKHYRLVDVPPVSTVRVGEKDLRLMRAVVKAAEAVNKFCGPRDWNALSRAVAALNVPGKGRK